MKESSFLASQALMESLRVYPGPETPSYEKESSFLASQALMESLRVCPGPRASSVDEAEWSDYLESISPAPRSPAKGSSPLAQSSARLGGCSPAKGSSPSAQSSARSVAWRAEAGPLLYSGATSSRLRNRSDHIETDVRMRLGIAPVEHEWRESQMHTPWV